MTPLLDRLLHTIHWETLQAPSDSIDDPDLQATHKGILKVEDFEIECYKCSNGEIAFNIEDMERFFRGCHRCDHPSHCPACNPTESDRCLPQEGLLLTTESEP